MAKTESTAVNELIGLVQNSRPMPLDPEDDLFRAPPASRASGRAASPAVASSHPARMTSTIPAMRGAGDVAPLPRARAPQSTAEQSIPALPESRVRMSTAPSPRGSTIPPLPPRASTPLPVRTSSSALPPPHRTTASSPFAAPARAATGTLPPSTAPVAAPFESLPAALAKRSSAALPLPRTGHVAKMKA